MAEDRYIVSRSNYSIKSKHKNTSNGTIYERDYMTTTQVGSFDGDVFSYNDGNFKFVRRLPASGFRKHNFGTWLKQYCKGSSNPNEYWTLGCINDNDTNSTTNEINIKPNYSSMLDFAYFGSCTELVKNTVKHIVSHFPAELYFSDRELSYSVNNDGFLHTGDTFEEDIKKAYAYLVRNGHTDEAVNLLRKSKLYGNADLREVSNPFNIDITSRFVDTTKAEIYNPLRYFYISSDNYSILNSEDTVVGCACNWEVIFKRKGCNDGDLTSVILINDNFNYVPDIDLSGLKVVTDRDDFVCAVLDSSDNLLWGIDADGVESIFFSEEDAALAEKVGLAKESYNSNKLLIYEYYIGGNYYLVTDFKLNGLKLRPTDLAVNNFYSDITDFAYLLLNPDSTPKHTCTIETPYEDEYGHKFYMKSYTWPTKYGWNLDIDSVNYDQYISSILEIADYYDEYRTNNLYGRMVHDAVKNLDLSYISPKGTDTVEDYKSGMAKMESLLMAYGWFFDSIKHSIDNIKSANVVTYDENSNTPDYFLSDTAEVSGWEVYSAVSGIDPNTNTLLDGKGTSIALSEVDLNFLRSLKINSKAIFSRKGTRDGIESLLSLFGMQSYDFAKRYYNNSDSNIRLNILKSYNNDAVIADTQLEFDRLSENGYIVEHMYDYRMDEFVCVANGGTEGTTSDSALLDIENKVYGGEPEPGRLSIFDGLPCRKYTVGYEDGAVFSYLVPWFDNLVEYEGNPYFQMYGGWGKQYLKAINLPELTNDGVVYSSDDSYVPMSEKIYYSNDQWSTGKYDSNVGVGDDYLYSLDNDADGWVSIRIDNLNIGDTVILNDSGTDNVMVVTDIDNKVIKKDSSTLYEVEDNGISIMISVRDAETPTVEHNHITYKLVKGVKIYDESEKYIGIVRSVGDLSKVVNSNLSDGDIYYVFDISDYSEYFNEANASDLSHYFILNDKNGVYVYGSEGWENIPDSHIRNNEYNGSRVLYLESIIDTNEANAPHFGKGNYDDGDEYLNYFRKIFYQRLKEGTFDDGVYDCDTGALEETVSEMGFNLELQRDNMKCWYFTDTVGGDKVATIKDNPTSLLVDEPVEISRYETTYDSDIEPYSFVYSSGEFTEKLPNYDVNAANSVINIKKLQIGFCGRYAMNPQYREYLLSSVIPYIKQMIPSTTIFEFGILGENGNITKFNTLKGNGTSEDSYVLATRYGALK